MPTRKKRKAEHIEESRENRAIPEDQAKARAWATANKESGGRGHPREESRSGPANFDV